MNQGYAPQHTWIGVGTRIETRARIRGNKNGFTDIVIIFICPGSS